MITDYEKFVMPDEGGGKEFYIEVNWDSNNPRTNESKILRITFPDGSQCHLRRENLNQVLFAIGNPEDQKRLIPQRIEKVHTRETVLEVKATQDIKKGECIRFPVKIDFPCTFFKEVIGKEAWEKDMKARKKRGLLR